ncbi:unnamed protein product [Lactuca saligna]|uniref:Uncharacterized protein n=1 Tax=Lactuca saligna TaxID=75948 RepID=A0AA35ZHZ1_LACSI|nr:unnamed protein product [Lactuca saligna]
METSLELQVNELRTLMDKNVKKLDDNYNLLHKKVDVVANATTRLIEDITAFNKEYLRHYTKWIFRINLLFLKNPFLLWVSNIESSIKDELAPILNLVLRLATNAQCPMHVSQVGDRRAAIGSSKGSGEDS